MPPPIKPRTVDTYQKEIRALFRLRAAIILDSGADTVLADRAIVQIDELVKTIVCLKDRVSGELSKLA